MTKGRFIPRGLCRLLCLCLMLPLALPANASAEAAAVGFTARALLPENQIGTAGYFHLLMEPGAEQTLYVEIANGHADAATLDITLQDAYTNENGLIAYGAAPSGETARAGIRRFASLALESLAGTEGVLRVEGSLLTLAPGALVRVPVALAMPEEPLEGHALGAVVATKLPQVSAQDAAFAVQSVYSYAIAVQLQTGETPAAQPGFALEGAFAADTAGWPGLTVTVKNLSPLVVTGAGMRLRVLSEDGRTPVLEAAQERVAMAPLSEMPYAVLIPDGTALPPGHYTVEVDWTHGGQTQKLQTEMTIGPRD